jgi:hypothetical protein
MGKMCRRGSDLSSASCEPAKILAEIAFRSSYALMTAGILLGEMGFDLRLLLPHVPTVVLWIVGGVAAVIGLFFITFFIICLRERQYLVGDVEPAKEPFPYTPARYWVFTRQDAFKLGWQHAGDFSTRKNTTMVKGMLNLFLSPDGSVMASIFSGSAAGAKLHKTLLRTRLSNGSILETCDMSGISDPTGMLSQATLMNAGIVELSEFHAQRLVTSGASAVPFNLANALSEYENIDRERGARWVQQGLAKWVDPQQTSIRMTFRGAMAQTKSMISRTRAMNQQSHRMHILRAGSRPADQQNQDATSALR